MYVRILICIWLLYYSVKWYNLIIIDESMCHTMLIAYIVLFNNNNEINNVFYYQKYCLLLHKI